MNEIEQIFDNIDQYTDNIDDLVRALQKVGINDYEQFKAAAREAGVPVRKSIQNSVAEKFSHIEEDDWSAAQDINTEESYLRYLKFYPEGVYRVDARKRIQDLSNPEIVIIPDDWENIDKNDINQLKKYIKEHKSDDVHIDEARKLIRIHPYSTNIKGLLKQISMIMADSSIARKDDTIYDKISDYIKSGKVTVEEFLSALENDNNIISGNVAYRLWEADIITDYSDAKIEYDFIQHMMAGATPVELSDAKSFSCITKVPSTEVYFWGIPSSGKSCAIGAILSAANNGRTVKSMMKDPKCQGYGYMNELADLFGSDGEIGTLPERTMATLGTTYEMGFDLKDEYGKVHPITCIDIAGEVFCDIHKIQSSGEESLKSSVYDVIKTLNKILIDNRTKNRKIHFFVIEYGAEDRKYKGIPQRTYLQSAVAYIQETGIFQKETDAVFILVTKVDKAHAVGKELQNKLKQYISDKYLGFYNGLKRICEENEINNGEVIIQPFTLGDVCFQYYCKFNERPAAEVVGKIISRSYGEKKDLFQKIKNKLKK